MPVVGATEILPGVTVEIPALVRCWDLRLLTHWEIQESQWDQHYWGHQCWEPLCLEHQWWAPQRDFQESQWGFQCWGHQCWDWRLWDWHWEIQESQWDQQWWEQ